MKITTKIGDSGTTELNNKRIQKSANTIELMLLGKLDMLNAAIGMCRDEIEYGHTQKQLKEIQGELIGISGVIATDSVWRKKESVQNLENEIEKIESEGVVTMAVKEFKRIHGSHYVSDMHFARTVCREAELYAWDWVRKIASDKNSLIPVYLNRLSDWLFLKAEELLECEILG